MKNDNRDFAGIWIPKQIYLNRDVCWSAKIIFLEIHSFSANEKECYISNAYLAEFLGISETQVSKHIGTLIEKGWVRQTRFDGRKRYLQSCLTVSFKAAFNQTSTLPFDELQGSHEEKFNHTNTFTNTDTNTSTNNFSASEKSSAETGAKKPSGEPPYYKMAVEAYFLFYENRTGIKPKFDGVAGKALKSVLKYLQDIDKDNVGPTELLQIIFHNWGKLPPWLQERCTIREISMNIDKIVNIFKNGQATSTNHSHSDLESYASELNKQGPGAQ